MSPIRVKAKDGRIGWKFRYVDPCGATMGAGGKRKDRRRHKVIWIGERREAEREFEKFKGGLGRRIYGGAGEECWAIPYADLCARFLSEAPGLSEHRRSALCRYLEQAGQVMELVVAGDLRNTAKLNAGVTELLKILAVSTVVEKSQGALKQMARWGAESKVLQYNPLADWRRVSMSGFRPRVRRAYTPDEMRAILDALAELDRAHGRRYPLAFVAKFLLLAGNRPGVLIDAKIADLDLGDQNAQEARVKLPPGRGKKKNGLCILPDEFLPELRVYLSKRLKDREGTILVSAKGEKLEGRNLYVDFMHAVTLAFTRLEWREADPALMGVDPAQLAFFIHRGTQRRVDGPRPTDPDKIEARKQSTARQVAALEVMRPLVEARLLGCDLYSIRKTHISWARRAGTNFDSVRAQVGHGPRDVEERHYLDLVDAGACPQAVLDVLEGRIKFESAAQRRRRQALERETGKHTQTNDSTGSASA